MQLSYATIQPLPHHTHTPLTHTTTTRHTANVRTLVVETCTGMSPQGWEKQYEVDVEDEHGSLQISTQHIPSAATYVKFKM